MADDSKGISEEYSQVPSISKEQAFFAHQWKTNDLVATMEINELIQLVH